LNVQQSNGRKEEWAREQRANLGTFEQGEDLLGEVVRLVVSAPIEESDGEIAESEGEAGIADAALVQEHAPVVDFGLLQVAVVARQFTEGILDLDEIAQGGSAGVGLAFDVEEASPRTVFVAAHHLHVRT
jgi:hypothetical protein